ncbi:general substrate transporter [Amanita rubescens]|nr:general substrate transporter [Amanita rubescens]
MLALVASIGGFIFGYDTGQISDILLMDDFKVRFAECATPGVVATCHFGNARSGVIVALLSIGTLAGALCGAPVADLLGRRRAMVIECFVFLIGVAIQLATIRVWQQFAVGRLISGFGVGALSAAVPLASQFDAYMRPLFNDVANSTKPETAPANIRGTLTATYQLFITLGILTAYCISIGTRHMPGAKSWRTVVGIGMIWPGLLSFGIMFMPESPRWLVTRGRVEEAKISIAKAHGLSTSLLEENKLVSVEVNKMCDHWEQERATRGGWIDCFKPKHKVLYRTLLGMALQTFQQLTGANYFFYYGATIFSSVGIVDPYVTQIILGAVNVVCTFGGLYVMEKFMAASGNRFGFLFSRQREQARDPATDRGIGKLMIVSACMFILGFAMTWAPGVWIIVGETFPTRTRAKQAALATASNWLWNFLLAFFTPFITSAIHFRYGFIFAACNLAGAVVVYLFVYESADLTLEGVDDMYNDANCRPWNSRKWKPAGYSSRFDSTEQAKVEYTEQTKIAETNASSSASSSM